MTTNPLVRCLQYIRRSASLRAGDEKTDGLLLAAYIQGRDSLALETLFWRHAPMVWGVCRRTLANHHDAEDAFQATFLVLVRKASSIRSRDLLANWLYGVAQKTAIKARQMAAKRSARERQMTVLPEPPQVDSPDGDFGPELRPLLDEELSRLPDKYRIAIVLCDLEERNRAEVSQQLRLPEGTVASRLARGRALLAKRLVRRGLTVSATSLAAVLTQQAASGSVPALLLTNTVKIILIVAENVTAAGAISTQVSALTNGVLQAMALAKRKAAGVVVLMAALVLSGGMVTYHLLSGQTVQPNPPEVRKPLDAEVEEKYGSEAGAMRTLPSSLIPLAARVDIKNIKLLVRLRDREKPEGVLAIFDGKMNKELYWGARSASEGDPR